MYSLMYMYLNFRCSNQEQVLGEIDGGLPYWHYQCHATKVWKYLIIRNRLFNITFCMGCKHIGMVITIAGRRWRHVFTTCSEVKGGWIFMEKWSSTIWTSVPVNSPLSRYSLPSPPSLAPVINVSFPSFQASYWSSKKYIVHGDVYDSDGVKVRHLFGTWHEALFCGENPDSAQCVWRIGTIIGLTNKRIWTTEVYKNFDRFSLGFFVIYIIASWCISPVAPMPEDYDQYFSFGQFAIELNELEEGLRDKLPQTDCRFRPDQR